MKSNSLVFKLVATFTIILAISYIVIATVLSIWVQKSYIDDRRGRLLDSSNFIENNVARYRSNQIDQASLFSSMDYLGKIVSNSQVILIDERNLVYFTSDQSLSDLMGKPLFKNTLIDLKSIENLRSGKIVELSGSISNSGTEYFTFIKPTLVEGDYVGSIVVLTPEATLKERIKNVFLIIWISSLIALIASTIVIYYFAQRILIKPLLELNTVANKMSRGDFTQRAVSSSDDEIGELAFSFNLMAESMDNTDKNRKEFISNISHELRSPITSIRGFISGILDGVIPKDKENYYLNVVYQEIQRLARLVNDLLDLSAMESGHFSIKMTEVDLNEIIRVSLVKFEQKISQKNLSIDVSLDSEHLYVAGDKDRLIQVVTNLLDNAIKHSNEGSNIELSTKVKGRKVYVSIYNDGLPISEEDKANIWQRFYKADKSRTNKVSTGLGLPIVRNILTQFGEDVWVENRETGVVFTFTLSKT